MSDLLPPAIGVGAEGAIMPPVLPVVLPVIAAAQPAKKGLDLAILKKGAKDYLDFLDSTKEVFFAYLYHRTGSEKLAKTLLGEIYLDVLSRAMSLWWFGTLGLKLLLDAAERALKDREITAADLDTVYLPKLAWFSDEEKKTVGTMHDALWTLPKTGQQILVLSLLIGLSDERIAEALRIAPAALAEQLRTAKELLISRWQPSPSVAEKLNSLVFVPSLDLQDETTVRFSIVEKYNALRFRRYQWVIIGGLFAVLSNVIVASVLAFAVITEPPTSLKGTRTQVASLDAVLLERQAEFRNAKQTVLGELGEAQRIAAYSATRKLTDLGLATALNALQHEEKKNEGVQNVINLLEVARTAALPYALPFAQIAMNVMAML